MKKVSYGKVSWIHLSHPNPQDILYLQENFDFPALAVEEFLTPTFRPKATIYENCLCLAMHIPLYDKNRRTTYSAEVDFILSKDHLITAHQDNFFQIDDLFSSVEKSVSQQFLFLGKTPAHLLHALLEALLESCFPRLDNITRKIDKVEDEVFSGKEKEMLQEISLVKRDILNFRRTLMPQRSLLESLTQKPHDFISPELFPFFQSLVGMNIRLWNTLQSAKETIESLEATNTSLLSHKLDEKMRIITIFSVLLLPSTIYANILGMNPSVPLDPSEGLYFWIHIGIILVIALLTLALFKWRRWI